MTNFGMQAGHAFAVIDGTLIPIDRVTADRPFYPGKHRPYIGAREHVLTPYLWSL
jgi:hypothetical protein